MDHERLGLSADPPRYTKRTRPSTMIPQPTQPEPIVALEPHPKGKKRGSSQSSENPKGGSTGSTRKRSRRRRKTRSVSAGPPRGETHETLQDGEFVVDRILGYKQYKKIRYAKVKWRGFRKPSWEPVDNIFQLRPKAKVVKEPESIVGQRTKNGFVEYKVHWSGSAKTSDSWIRGDKLNRQDLVDEFTGSNPTGEPPQSSSQTSSVSRPSRKRKVGELEALKKDSGATDEEEDEDDESHKTISPMELMGDDEDITDKPAEKPLKRVHEPVTATVERRTQTPEASGEQDKIVATLSPSPESSIKRGIVGIKKVSASGSRGVNVNVEVLVAKLTATPVPVIVISAPEAEAVPAEEVKGGSEPPAAWKGKLVDQWTDDDVSDYLTANGFSDPARKFHEKGIDGKAFINLMDPASIQRFEVPLGPSLKIFKLVRELRVSPQSSQGSS